MHFDFNFDFGRVFSFLYLLACASLAGQSAAMPPAAPRRTALHCGTLALQVKIHFGKIILDLKNQLYKIIFFVWLSVPMGASIEKIISKISDTPAIQKKEKVSDTPVKI